MTEPPERPGDNRAGARRMGHHAGMVLRIDPRLSLVWRTPHDLQVGADRPDAVLAALTDTDERLVAALRIGTTRTALGVLAGECGASHSTVEELLARLGDAVESGRPAPQPEAAVVVERERSDSLGPPARVLAGALRAAGAVPGDMDAEPVTLAVLVAAHVPSPVTAARWLGRNVPHLPVIFGDETVEVGPLVRPGETACLHCVTRHRLDDDPSWAAVAAQLAVGRHPVAAAANPLLVHAAVVEVLRTFTALHAGRASERDGVSVRLRANGAEVSERRWSPHPGCSCRALPGTGTPPVSRPDAGRSRPRTAAATTGPA